MPSPARPRTRLQTALALAISGTSLAALVLVGVGALESEVAAADQPREQPGELQLHANLPKLEDHEATAKPKPAPARADSHDEAPVEAATPTTEPEPVDMVTVPDVSGERLWIARRHLSDAGLKMAPRDGRRKVPTAEYPAYEVASSDSFGKRVPVGSVIEVGVDWWTPAFARGY